MKMSRIRKNHSADFKAQVALAAIREDATISELASRYGIHATVIHRWKKEAIEAMTSGFSGKQERQQNDHTVQIKELHAKIGQLTVERDFLADASKRLGLFGGKKW
jgi:transposase